MQGVERSVAKCYSSDSPLRVEEGWYEGISPLNGFLQGSKWASRLK
jgi:hypothetical protein